MRGKNILITGASEGIGNGSARYLLEKGANVVLVSRNEEKLLSLKEEYPSQVSVYPFDLTQLEDIEKIFIFCYEQGIKLHGLLHSAGVGENCPIKNVDVSFMQETMTINAFAYMQLCKYFALRKYSYDGSSIVAMSSIAAFHCSKGMSQYTSSKAAVNAFTQVMSKEMVKRKIRVNAIAPGFVDTNMTWKQLDLIENFGENLPNVQPYGVIPVEQIAYLIEFLLSDKSAYITGAIIPVSAGNF